MEFQDSDFGLAKSWLLWPFGEWTRKWKKLMHSFTPISLPFHLSPSPCLPLCLYRFAFQNNKSLESIEMEGLGRRRKRNSIYGCERERDKTFRFTGSLLRCLHYILDCLAEARSWEFSERILHGRQEFNHLTHHCCLPEYALATSWDSGAWPGCQIQVLRYFTKTS